MAEKRLEVAPVGTLSRVGLALRSRHSAVRLQEYAFLGLRCHEHM